MAVFHIKDHLKQAGETSVERKMRAPGSAGKSFDVVRAICNGTKHVVTDPSHPIQFRAGEDFDRPPWAFGEAELGISRGGDAVGGREIGHNPKQRIDIYEACKITLEAFCATFPDQLGDCDLSGL